MRPVSLEGRARAGLTVSPLLAALTLFASPAHAQAPDVSNLPRFDSNWQAVIKPGAGFWSIGGAQEFATSGPGSAMTSGPVAANLIANARQVFGPAGEMTYFEVLDGVAGVRFVSAWGDTFTPIGSGRLVYARASDWTRQAVIADPLKLGWSYQTFAAWQTGVYSTTGSMGAATFGAETGWAGSTTVPQTGSATFTGFMGGIYNDVAGETKLITADVGIRMDYAAHTAEFWTTNTQQRENGAVRDLDISGTFVGLPNYPQMFGTLNTARLTGVSTGRFFGPGGVEFGGTFTLAPRSGLGPERLVGAFGSKLGVPPPPPGSGFASWSASAKAGSTLVVSGVMAEAAFNHNTSGGGSSSPIVAANSPGAYSQTLDANGALVAAKWEGGNYPASFSVAGGDSFGRLGADPRMLYASDPKRVRGAIMADPTQFGWDYQSFGAWESSTTTTFSTSGAMSVASVGLATPGAGIPTTGGATFQGAVTGAYLKLATDRTLVTADITFNANFGGRNAIFSTTAMRSASDGQVFADTAVNGWVSWIPADNNLYGRAATVDGRLTGTVSGRFYGPGAQEVGGTFALNPLNSIGNERLAGAFGAKR